MSYVICHMSYENDIGHLPAVCTTKSPNDLDIANPGTLADPSHTLAGPTTPSLYRTEKTLPPALRMRVYSPECV
jgi:hypothetical protein